MRRSQIRRNQIRSLSAEGFAFFTFSYSVLVKVLRNWQYPRTLVCFPETFLLPWKPTKRHEVQQFLIRIQYNWTKSIFSFFFSVGVEDKASVLQNSLLQWMAQRFLDKGISHLYGFSFSFSFLHVEGAEIEQWNTEWSLQVSFAIRCPEFFSIEKIDSESSALLQQRVGGTQAFLSDPRREGSLNRAEKCRSFWKTIRAVPGVEQLYKDKYSSLTEDAFPSMCYSTKA